MFILYAEDNVFAHFISGLPAILNDAWALVRKTATATVKLLVR